MTQGCGEAHVSTRQPPMIRALWIAITMNKRQKGPRRMKHALVFKVLGESECETSASPYSLDGKARRTRVTSCYVFKSRAEYSCRDEISPCHVADPGAPQGMGTSCGLSLTNDFIRVFPVRPGPPSGLAGCNVVSAF